MQLSNCVFGCDSASSFAFLVSLFVSRIGAIQYKNTIHFIRPRLLSVSEDNRKKIQTTKFSYKNSRVTKRTDIWQLQGDTLLSKFI